MGVRFDGRDERAGVLCADFWCHSLVYLKIVYAQEDTLLMQLCCGVPHRLRSLCPFGFSFSIKFNWSPSISDKIRTDRPLWRWQTQKFLTAQYPAQRAHHCPHLAPTIWNLGNFVLCDSRWQPSRCSAISLLNSLRKSYFRCDSSLNYRLICFIKLVLCCLRHTEPCGSIKYFHKQLRCHNINCVHTLKERYH